MGKDSLPIQYTNFISISIDLNQIQATNKILPLKRAIYWPLDGGGVLCICTMLIRDQEGLALVSGGPPAAREHKAGEHLGEAQRKVEVAFRPQLPWFPRSPVNKVGKLHLRRKNNEYSPCEYIKKIPGKWQRQLETLVENIAEAKDPGYHMKHHDTASKGM